MVGGAIERPPFPELRLRCWQCRDTVRLRCMPLPIACRLFLLLHRHREQAAFAVEGMIPRRQDCEDDRRSWRIAICRCDAAAHNFVAFSRKPFLRPLESSYKLSPRILELEMHSVVLRFTFC